MRGMLFGLATVLLLCAATVRADYTGWQHSGSMFILTTPEGADLPAGSSETDFPLLVRLNKDTFDFSRAQAGGQDIRFSAADGTPLAYQIEQWDAAKGIASIWVRIPVIKGNSRQEIKMHWGKPDAASESKGAAVFSENNGYVSVLHLGEEIKDEVGSVTPKDHGTTVVDGLIGQARHFDAHKGIACGEELTTLPSGSSPNTSEVWFRAETTNSLAMAWGNEHSQGKVTMGLHSPPHMRMDLYWCGGNVDGTSAIPMNEWVHIVHTYKNGDSRLYVNGKLDGVSTHTNSPLDIKSPAKMWIGGWYNDYRFVGDIDEVRLSKVTRSADWVKLEYENQKPLQTLVGSLVKPGNAFSVSSETVTIDEGKTATLTGQAGGAQKVYWILKRDGAENIVAVDQPSYSISAGRVVGDKTCVLQFKAVYGSEVKTKDIAIATKDTIPEPVFTLKAPEKWNGRDAIEVVPNISNLAAMTSAGVDKLHYAWSVSGGAVIKEIAPDKLILKRSQYTGPIAVKVAIDNGGTATVATATIQVTEPKSDPWVQRVPDKDEKPEEGQFYARDDKNEGTLYYNGTLDKPADMVFLKLYADDKLIKTETQKPGAGGTYAFTIKLAPGLVKYKVVFGTIAGDIGTAMNTVENLVCGDAYIIDGQSNALATDTGEKSPLETSEWIRSYGGQSGRGDATGWVRDRFSKGWPNLWCSPVWKAEKGEKAELGWWGMELAKRLVASNKMPVFIINAAVGGTRIDEHQANPADHTDLNTMYGRMLWRVQQAKLTHGIRGILWHQGENDQGSDGPDGGYGWETYTQYFINMSACWKQDMPNVQHYYIFQIWPNSCSMGGGHGDMLREIQRELPGYYSNMGIMSTLGVKPPGGCHFPLIGWSEFARLIQPLIERDNYGKTPTDFITPPNLKKASFASTTKDTITLEFDQPVEWSDKLESQFYLDGLPDKFASGSVAGNVITLKLKEPATGAKITYLHETRWSQEHLLLGKNGIAALSFCDVPIAAKP